MAKELVEVMVKFGFPTFPLIGHDRGGRVAYRIVLTENPDSNILMMEPAQDRNRHDIADRLPAAEQ